jgi:hypothetical protein
VMPIIIGSSTGRGGHHENEQKAHCHAFPWAQPIARTGES